MNTYWKNPYAVERKYKKRNKTTQEPMNPTATPVKGVTAPEKKDAPKKNPTEANADDLLQMMGKFHEGIKDISSSVQQFEKTVESMSQLYGTFKKLGGVEKLNQLLAASSQKSPRVLSRPTEASNPLQPLSQIMSVLEKIDFNQINQFLVMMQGLMADTDKKEEK